jgi:macrolide transport system ATP-binding/permease protein
MKTPREFLRKLQLYLSRERFANDLSDEMAFHREQKVKELVAGGMHEREAREAAERAFGNATRTAEESHDVVAFQFESALQDFRFAVRQLKKNPGFAVTAILILALGIGASATIFAFVNAVLIKPLPYPDPSRIVAVTETVMPLIPRAVLSYPDFLDWKRSSTSFDGFDVYSGRSFLLPGADATQRVRGARVTDGFFNTLRTKALLGRTLQPGDDAAKAQVVVLSYAGWQKYFGGRPDVVGQTATLSGVPFTVVGVLPKDFQFAVMGDVEVWSPMEPLGPCDQRRSCHFLGGIARLKDGVTLQAADQEMRAIAAQLEKQYPGSNRGQGGTAYAFSEEVTGKVRPILMMLMGGSLLLLIIACVNVTSLLLARSETRRREIAVRGAMGASFGRLVRQFAIEGLVLVVSGGLAGILFAAWAMRVLMKLVSPDMLDGLPMLRGLGLNANVLAYAVEVTLLAAVLFAVVPVLRIRAADLHGGMVDGGRGASSTSWRRVGSNLVVAELAIAAVLLVGAGLLTQSLYRVLRVPLGFHSDHLATLLVNAPRLGYEKPEQQTALARRLTSDVANLPGVRSADIATIGPVSFNGNTDWIRFVGKPFGGEHNEVNERDVTPGYFSTLQARLIRGRFFTREDEDAGRKVAVINETLAKKYFPDEDPVGKKYGDMGLSPDSIKEIVGVVEDIREGSLDSEVWPAEYLPFSQDPDTGFVIVARTAQDPSAALPMMMDTVHKTDSGLASMFALTMDERIALSQTAYFHRSSAWLVGAFSALALLLSVVGLYGVISYSVSQRTREIGVRMALGAEPRSVYKMILEDAGRLAVVGVGIGLVAAVLLARLAGKLLFGVASWDAPTLAGVALLLLACALSAAFLPARRAASLDPVDVLRAE